MKSFTISSVHETKIGLDFLKNGILNIPCCTKETRVTSSPTKTCKFYVLTRKDLMNITLTAKREWLVYFNVPTSNQPPASNDASKANLEEMCLAIVHKFFSFDQNIEKQIYFQNATATLVYKCRKVPLGIICKIFIWIIFEMLIWKLFIAANTWSCVRGLFL